MNNIGNRCEQLDSDIDELKKEILGEFPCNDEDDQLTDLINLAMSLGEAYVYQDRIVMPKDPVNEIRIELLNFDKEIDVASFEVTRDRSELFTCDATVDLDDFLIGEQIIKPRRWLNSEDVRTEKPNWFKKNELFLLNDVFEENFRKFL